MKPFAWLDLSNPGLCYWKTWQRCLIEDFQTYSERWPRSGIAQNGTAYKLPTLAPRISGTGCLSSRIPTPRAQARTSSKRTISEYRHNPEEFVMIWPTPAARDWKSGKGRQKNGHTPQLPEVTGGQLNPTWVEWLMGFPSGWTDSGA